MRGGWALPLQLDFALGAACVTAFHFASPKVFGPLISHHQALISLFQPHKSGAPPPLLSASSGEVQRLTFPCHMTNQPLILVWKTFIGCLPSVAAEMFANREIFGDLSRTRDPQVHLFSGLIIFFLMKMLNIQLCLSVLVLSYFWNILTSVGLKCVCLYWLGWFVAMYGLSQDDLQGKEGAGITLNLQRAHCHGVSMANQQWLQENHLEA